MNAPTNDAQWYIARDGKQHGPLTDVEMKTFVGHNYLRPTDLIWKAGMPDWQPAPQVFAGLFQPPAPSAAPPAPQPTHQPMQQPAASVPQQQQQQSPMATTASAPHHTDLGRDQFEDKGARRGLVRQVAVAALAIALIGGGAFAIAAYREPLMRIVSGPQKKPTAAVSEETAEKTKATDSSIAEVKPEMKTAALDPTAPAPMPAPVASIENSQTDLRLQKIPLWELLKREYPDWYANHIAAADKLTAEKKSETDIATHLLQGLVTLRKQNAEKALTASPEKLKRIATAFLENLRALQAQSVGACYGYISKGELSPAVVQMMQTPESATTIHASASAIFEAVSEGIKSPVKHDSAVKADYDMLIQELGKLGWKEEDLQVFSNPRLLAKREPAQVCKMVQDWFVAHLAVQDAAAQDRLLFETLKPVVSG
jgi:GYF domain 2